MASSSSRPPGETDRTARASLIVSCAASLIVFINFTLPIATVPRITADLEAGLSAQTWILGGISLGLAAFLLVAGGLADDYGRKRAFVAGAIALALATVLCALAPNTTVFIIGRGVQGVGSAALLAASLGLLGHSYPPGPERARATGLWGAMIGGGIIVGLLLSATLVPLISWRGVFGILAGLSVLLATAAIVTLVESRNPTAGRVDIAGALCLAGGIGFLVTGLTEGRIGWAKASVLVFFALAAVLLAAFIIIELRTANPLLDLTLLTRPDFLASTFGAFFTGAAIVGFTSYIPNAAHSILSLGVAPSAGIFAVWAGTSFLSAPQARRLIPLIGARHQVVIGLVITAVGHLALLGIDEHSTWWRFVPGLAIAGIASGVVNAALAGMAVQSVPPHQVAMGSGANNTARYLGSAVGVAVVAVIITIGSQHSDAPHGYAGGMTYAAAVTAGMSLIGALVVALCRTGRTGRTMLGT